MIIWFSLLVPIISSIVAYFIWKKKFVWWELTIPTALCFILVLIMKFTVETTMTSDTQYKSGMIDETKYYEYYSTWVTKTCSERYACGSHREGSGKNAHTVTDYCTRYYDCSYCDENSAHWEIYDDKGHEWSISKEKYLALTKSWKNPIVKKELNRDIREHGSCGVDGNAYSISWDKDLFTAESSTWSESYENRVQVSRSNFDLKEVSEDDAKKYGLYDYPQIDKYSQKTILGLDSMKFLDAPHRNGAHAMFDYLNGQYGAKRKIKLFVLLFSNKDISIAIKQKDYWDGGNKNEVVICIDLDRNTGKINWVYPFTWSANKRVAIDLREDINNLGTMNFTKMFYIVDKSTESFVYRNFKEFNYLEFEPPLWEVWMVYLITFAITIGVLVYGFKNEFEL